MTTALTTTVTATNMQPIINLVCKAVTSDHTKRAYSRALTDFITWHSSTAQAVGRVEGVRKEGKRSKTRSVPMPSWAKYAIDAYLLAGVITDGVLFRSVRRGYHIQAEGMTAQAIFDVVRTYAQQIGVDVRPHDLRRTFAKLAHKGNAPIEQIQLSLGHSSVQTTERYIGVQQDLSSAPCDALGLRI